MKRSAASLFASLVVSVAVFGLATPRVTYAAAAGHGMAPRFSGMHRPGQPTFARQEQRRGFGVSSAVYPTTLQSGTFETPSEESGYWPPAPFYGVPPPFYGVAPPEAPPQCIKPVLIHLTPERTDIKLPRVVYGTPLECPE